MESPFTRDKVTWLAYALLGYFAYQVNTIGPLMPFLRAELGLSFAEGSLHLSASAGGMIGVSLLADRLARRFGRRYTLWGGAVGMVAGTLLLVAGHHPVVTIAGALLTGFPGGLLLVMIQAILSDHHGDRRAIALTEANVLAALTTMFAPALIGGFERIGIGWRAALLLSIAGAALIATVYHRVLLPLPKRVEADAMYKNRGLPAVYWAYWGMLLLLVATEISVVAWGADFLVASLEFARADAVTTMSVLLAAIFVGRLVGSRLARRFETRTLLLGAILLSLIAFLLLWRSALVPLTIACLALTGLGLANLYPLTVTLAVGAAPADADRASARASVATGIAIAAVPLLLGWIADRIG
ncbi:MAG TPA: MFS transporter, partial [Ardenticatenaceae bacterium]|nr:MFS transporter [Ardenticatenaceae bacterium]